MFKKTLIVAAMGMASFSAMAEDVQINGFVQSRCIISTDNTGTFGNPNSYTLTTSPAEGGEYAVVRYDVTLADAYYAEITAPTSFSMSPTLPDVVTWEGDTEVHAVSDAANMGNYEVDKIEYNYTDKYDLTATGSTWFRTSSTATMGGNKAFPGGAYTAIVQAECIAK